MNVRVKETCCIKCWSMLEKLHKNQILPYKPVLLNTSVCNNDDDFS